MSFVLNGYQQISLFDSLGFLSERKQKILENSWAKPFSDIIFANIDEMIFAPLYSDKRNSRPNAPVNVIVGALILKELDLLGGLDSYKNPCNRNQVIYHDSKTPQDIKIQKIIDDAVDLLPKCKEDYGATTDYQLLERAINEQTKNDNGKRILKTKEDAMPSDILQNPSMQKAPL